LINQIINGDCLEVMQSIPDKSIDMILTDPPYGISYASNMRVKSQKFDMLDNDDNEFRFSTYPVMHDKLKDNSVAVIFCSWKNMAYDYLILKKLFSIKNVLIWHKGGGGIGDLKHSLLTDYEIAMVCHKGKRRINGKREGSILKFNKVNPNAMVHPTQKPESLIEKLMGVYSNENDTILDCYSGSGTTAIACINTNRNYICIEKDKAYFDLSVERVNNHKQNLFNKAC